MELQSLRVLHLHKPSAEHALCSQLEGYEVSWVIDTCQRTLWIYEASEDGQERPLPGVGELLAGPSAYRFLLRVASGLESEVLGETDVFGQIKDAWAKFESQRSPLVRALSPWVQRLFEDTKEIRARFLQNTGGASYGSLVRKLFREHSTGTGESVLVIGAGHIAHAVGPWLTERELLIWNRTPESARLLAQAILSKDPKARIRVLETEAEEALALRTASHAVVCIPADPESDSRRIALWQEGMSLAGGRSLIHLGALAAQAGEWNRLPNFHPLDDVFAMQRDQGGSRMEQFSRAMKACDEKALLRSMPGPHGWEDLALFG